MVRLNWNEPCAQSLFLILIAFLSQKATFGAVYPAVYQAHAHMQSESEESGEESGARKRKRERLSEAIPLPRKQNAERKMIPIG